MDLNNFKLLKEDTDTYSLAHPNGQKFTVQKSGLIPKAKAAIEKMKGQHFDNGGLQADDSSAPAGTPININVGAAPQQAAQEPGLQDIIMSAGKKALGMDTSVIPGADAPAPAMTPYPGSLNSTQPAQPSGLPANIPPPNEQAPQQPQMQSAT